MLHWRYIAPELVQRGSCWASPILLQWDNDALFVVITIPQCYPSPCLPGHRACSSSESPNTGPGSSYGSSLKSTSSSCRSLLDPLNSLTNSSISSSLSFYPGATIAPCFKSGTSSYASCSCLSASSSCSQCYNAQLSVPSKVIEADPPQLPLSVPNEVIETDP